MVMPAKGTRRLMAGDMIVELGLSAELKAPVSAGREPD